MISLGGSRLRPTATSLVAALGLLGAISFDAVRDFVWADLRAGLLDLRGLARSTRVLVWLGFGLLIAMIGVLLFNDLLRAQFPLLPLVSGVPGRGTQVPLPLAPTTLFVLAIAWSFALAGALRSHPAVRLAVLTLYLVEMAPGIGQIARVETAAALPIWGALLGAALYFAVRARARARPAVDFAVLLGFVGLTFVLVQARGLEEWRYSGTPLVLGRLGGAVLSLFALILPLLLRIGLNLATFAFRASGWLSEIAEQRLPPWALPGLLLLLVAVRVHEVVPAAVDTIRGAPSESQVPALLGSLVVPLGVGLVWWLTERARGGTPTRTPGAAPGVDEVAAAAERWALPIVLAYFAPQLAAFVALHLGAAVAAILPDYTASIAVDLLAISLAHQINADLVTRPWRLLIAGLALAGAVPLARRGVSPSALYLGTFGLLALRTELTAPGRPLDRFGGSSADDLIQLWWLALFVLVGAGWLLRGRLSQARAGRLLLVLTLGALLPRTDFLSNPFSPVLGFAGLYFIAFGLIWDALTIGSWANAASVRLPRLGRIFLYLGYVLVTVAVINWQISVHDLAQTNRILGDQAVFGLNLLGLPMVYAIFAAALGSSWETGVAPAGDQPAHENDPSAGQVVS